MENKIMDVCRKGRVLSLDMTWLATYEDANLGFLLMPDSLNTTYTKFKYKGA